MRTYLYLAVLYITLIIANLANAQEQKSTNNRVLPPKTQVHTNHYICNDSPTPHVYVCINLHTGKKAQCSVNWETHEFECS